MNNKPPIGVSPHWFVHLKRITELHEAIGRYIAHIEHHQSTEPLSTYYELIAQWAEELEAVALLEAKLKKREEKGE